MMMGIQEGNTQEGSLGILRLDKFRYAHIAKIINCCLMWRLGKAANLINQVHQLLGATTLLGEKEWVAKSAAKAITKKGPPSMNVYLLAL